MYAWRLTRHGHRRIFDARNVDVVVEANIIDLNVDTLSNAMFDWLPPNFKSNIAMFDFAHQTQHLTV